MRYFLLTGNINKIDLYIVGIKIYLYYLIFHISQKYFNILKNALYIKKLIISQIIIFNRNMIISNKSLVTAISIIKHDQVINKTYHKKLQNIKILTIIKI